jgi:hypothetical protein
MGRPYDPTLTALRAEYGAPWSDRTIGRYRRALALVEERGVDLQKLRARAMRPNGTLNVAEFLRMAERA